MRHGADDTVVIPAFGQIVEQFEVEKCTRLFRIGLGVVHVHRMAFSLQGSDQIDHLGVAEIGHVFLERQPQYQHPALLSVLE